MWIIYKEIIMKIFVFFLAVCLVYVNSHSSKGEDTCNGPPNVYCNCGNEGLIVPNVHPRRNILQGSPGKSGVQGVKGQKGTIGQKGEAGTPDDTVEELQQVKAKLKVLNDTNRELKVVLKTQSEELNDTSEQLQQVQTELKDLKDYLFSPPRSCDYLNKTRDSSGTYLISPDPMNIQPFYVYCNFNGSSKETIIHHDSEAEIQVSNCGSRRCYKRSIHYTASLQQIEALIQRSSQCRQFIKYRCINSILQLYRNPSTATWLSRDGSAKLYWGGATSQRDGYCACGEAGNCVNSNKCNCDANDYTERFDEGYLTDKGDLPVTGLQFGDASASAGEKGWHTLGPLICS